jgi:antibiotic biosynthesis monooxygenase (ABM) superfamily enzyme
LTNAVRILNAPPPRWKQAITIWLGFFPLSLAINFLVIAHLGTLPLVVKTLIATVINTPLMVYLVLPWITARLKRWL